MSTLGIEERAVVDIVADWVDREVKPVVRDLEHANAYPDKPRRSAATSIGWTSHRHERVGVGGRWPAARLWDWR